jgi:hypothetical protein
VRVEVYNHAPSVGKGPGLVKRRSQVSSRKSQVVNLDAQDRLRVVVFSGAT